MHNARTQVAQVTPESQDLCMPYPRSQLPQLPPTFTTRDAIAAGATIDALRHPSFRVPFPGIRATTPEVPAASLRESVLNSARDFAPRLRPGEAVSHTSALLLYACPIRTDRSLHVTALAPLNRSRVRGVRGHRHCSAEPIHIGPVEGIPTVDPLTALAYSSTYLPLRELIVAADHLRRKRGYRGQIPALEAAPILARHAAQFRGAGVRHLRLAVDLSRAGAESRMETLTRLVLVAFGLDTFFDAQVELSDCAGRIGRFDLVSRTPKVIVEYDGDQHRTSKLQHARDLHRLDRARELGYTVIRLVQADIIDRPRETAKRVAAALGVNIRMHELANLLLVRD